MVAVEFFLVPTLTFRLLFGFVVLCHHRRELLHVNVTDHPTAAWTAEQIVDAFPDETAPRYLLRDRDAIYGDVFHGRVDRLGIHEVLIAPHAPWQNPFAERVIGSIPRECLDHFIVLNERHLRRLLLSYLAYCDTARPHPALGDLLGEPIVFFRRRDGRVVALEDRCCHRHYPLHDLPEIHPSRRAKTATSWHGALLRVPSRSGARNCLARQLHDRPGWEARTSSLTGVDEGGARGATARPP